MLQLTQIVIDDIRLVRPTRDQICLLAPGDFAPDCFGRLRRVTRIAFRGTNDCGKRFVCYYTEFGENPATQQAECSHAMVEGEIVVTLPATNRWQRSTLIPWGQMDGVAARRSAEALLPLLSQRSLFEIVLDGLPPVGPLRDQVEEVGRQFVGPGEVLDADCIAGFVAASKVAQQAYDAVVDMQLQAVYGYGCGARVRK